MERTNNKRASIDIDAVFDIETQDWDKFVYGGILYSDGEYRDYSWEEQKEFIDDLLAIDGTVYAHNGGRFDVLYVLDQLVKTNRCEKATIIATGSRIAMAEIGKTKIADSCALVPLSLEKAAKIGGVDKLETNLDCECGKSCGGYCAIRVGMGGSRLVALRRYLKGDCEATLKYLKAISLFAEDNDLDLKLTIGASAWSNLSRTLNIKQATWKNDEHLYKRARAGYYGGRVQVFNPNSLFGYRADINSAYPAALQQISVPYGNPKGYGSSELTENQWNDNRPGVYEATVNVPRDLFVPPLPVKLRDGRIAYPVGTLRGSWTKLELENAIAHGCEIVDFRSCVVWPRLVSLRDWVDKIWGLRFAAGKSTALGTWVKFYANSLTGKFAQRPEKTCWRLGEPKTLRGWELVYPAFDVWKKDVSFHAKNSHVQFAAYLTASARISLYKQLSKVGKQAVYCDTDSCYAETNDFANLGKELGQWDLEGEYHDFCALAPKFYRFINPATGKRVVRSKGMPEIDFELFDAFRNGETISQERGVRQFKSGLMAGELFGRKHLTRSNKQDGVRFGDRILANDGLTYPCDIVRLQKWTTPGTKEHPTIREPLAYATKSAN